MNFDSNFFMYGGMTNNGGQLHVPIAGTYITTALISFQAATAAVSIFDVQIFQNSVAITTGDDNQGGTLSQVSNYRAIHRSVILKCAAGDLIGIGARADSSTNQTTGIGAPGNYLQAAWMGA